MLSILRKFDFLNTLEESMATLPPPFNNTKLPSPLPFLTEFSDKSFRNEMPRIIWKARLVYISGDDDRVEKERGRGRKGVESDERARWKGEGQVM